MKRKRRASDSEPSHSKKSAPSTHLEPHELYLAQFRQHLVHVRNHLAGHDDTVEDYEPVYLPPAGLWTRHENDIFFHALAIHSRFRPDLIAASLPSKSLIDVCAYIDQLEEASFASGRPTNSRADLAGAMEVDGTWVSFETSVADLLMKIEPVWDVAQQEREHTEMLEEMRQNALDVDGISETERAVELEGVKQEHESMWAREAALSTLDLTSCRKLDRILDAIEQPNTQDPTSRAQSPESSTSRSLSIQTPPLAELDPAELSPNSRRLYNNRMYQRRRRAALRGEVANETTSKLIPVKNSKKTVVPVSADGHDSDSDQEDSPPQPINAPISIQLAPTDVELDPALMSPRSRKLHMNRLCQRRRRAALKGVVANETTARLPAIPTKKPMKSKSLSDKPIDDGGGDAAEDEDGQDDEEPPEDEGLPNKPKRKRKSHPSGKSGLTRAQRQQEILQTVGVTAQTLHEDHMGLFRLSALSRRLESINTAQSHVYARRLDRSEQHSVQTLSGNFVSLLGTILRDFTTQVVHKAIVDRECEVRAKRHTKAWKLVETQISVNNIERTLAEICSARFFGLDRLEESSESDKADADTGDDEEDIESEDDEEEEPTAETIPDEGDPIVSPFLLSPYRELYPVFIYAPQEWKVQGTDSTATTLAADQIDLMDVEADEELLNKELEEEAQLDAADTERDKEYRCRLWEEVSIDKDSRSRPYRLGRESTWR